MAKVLDWKRSDDTRDIVHLSVQALAEGHLIAIPTCTTYFAVGNGLNGDVCERISDLARRASRASVDASNPVSRPAALLVVRGPDEIIDFCPDACQTSIRLANRVWPGPLQILLPSSHRDSLLHQLPSQSLQTVTNSSNQFAVSMPSHSVIAEILRLSAGPLVMTELLDHSTRTPAITAESVDQTAIAMVIDAGITKYQGRATLLEVADNRCQIISGGVTSKTELQSVSRLMVLLVCTGNTCRSPMAETLMQAKLLKRIKELNGLSPSASSHDFFVPIVALSAGIASGGGPASPQAIEAMSEYGLDLTNHQSCAVTEKEIESADVILAMTRSHRQAIISRWPGVADKTHLLSGNGEDVSDPFGGPVQLYRECAEKIDDYLDRWIERLLRSPLPSWTES